MPELASCWAVPEAAECIWLMRTDVLPVSHTRGRGWRCLWLGADVLRAATEAGACGCNPLARGPPHTPLPPSIPHPHCAGCVHQPVPQHHGPGGHEPHGQPAPARQRQLHAVEEGARRGAGLPAVSGRGAASSCLVHAAPRWPPPCCAHPLPFPTLQPALLLPLLLQAPRPRHD